MTLFVCLSFPPLEMVENVLSVGPVGRNLQVGRE